MNESENGEQDQVPFFSIRFSPIEGTQVLTNMAKEETVYQLEKFCLLVKLDHPAIKGVFPVSQSPVGLTGPA